jgi:hypothetical protein
MTIKEADDDVANDKQLQELNQAAGLLHQQGKLQEAMEMRGQTRTLGLNIQIRLEVLVTWHRYLKLKES